ncbi:WD repeat domain 16 [Salpingoeca rosetta]|uniref:Cilia- and flagella-associated protein 52 n=1 Tax=Salpingoeca rosetta (strain ATCC 50818 / BSB-021) TaxID=946362 RepID=F2UIH6_SALR5|nr:WD repeat domain 16 [Salpingoeca rosetta]EGD76925.1 WD repeat domain 16 [Salpingoeca rosetta]|eukprot:XP_004991296.1 WD repeat domain 16 [Salpingoeca rosetta]
MQELELLSTIGFGGSVRDGLHVHPERQHLVYPLGCTVVVEKIGGKRSQQFLQGHTDKVSCVTVSPSGRYIASGQITHQGYAADIIIWDFKTLALKHRLTLHKVKVADLSFSPTEKFLVSLGGEDDGTLALWDVESGQALAGAPTADTSGGHAATLSFTNRDDFTFVSGGKYTIRVWDINPRTHALTPTNCVLRSLRRLVTCMAISADDELAYCGTSTGDVVIISIPHKVLKGTGPAKNPFPRGVSCIATTPTGELLVGAGNGTIARCSSKSLKPLQQNTLVGAVTSIALTPGGSDMYVGTDDCDIYRCGDVSTYEERAICHPHGVCDVEFPRGTSDLFATCSHHSVRVWHTPTGKQLLAINVPGVKCNAMTFTPDGKLIVTGWEDGVIRGFLPQSGKEKFNIQHAHNNGVTAIAVTNDSGRIVSGGGDGLVRVWRLGKQSQTLLESMKEHKGAVTDIRVRSNDEECVSSSADGSCIIWDLNRFVRNQIMFASSVFSQVRYRPDEAQLLTCGSDRKVHYWEAFDGSLIRELEVSSTGALYALDISPDGRYFAAGGQDKLLKLITFDEGETAYVGQGHSGDITRVAICPNQQYIISVTNTGSIFRWAYPAA